MHKITFLTVIALTVALAGASAARSDTSVGADCVKPPDLVSPNQDFSNCNLKGVTVDGDGILYYSNFSGANLMGASFSGDSLAWYSNLFGANLSGATIGGTYKTFFLSDVRDANLAGATISGGLAFRGADLSDANLNRATVSGGGGISSANLTGANLGHATVTGQGALWDSDLTNANLNGATILWPVVGAIYNNTLCPDGSNSDHNGGTCIGHGVPQ